MEEIDVTVIGGGLAGMAASIHLVKAGLRVLCVEAAATGTDAVGESLDWSSPALLEDLGLPMEELIGKKIATYKRHVILKLQDGSEQHYLPGSWLGRPPFRVELRTLHVDRTELNAAIRNIAVRERVLLFWKVAMHRALAGQDDAGIAAADFYRPFSGLTGPWKFMKVLLWGKPADILANVPGFLSSLCVPTLIFHGAQDVAIPELFARRASRLIPNAQLVVLDSGHFIPLRQPESVAASLAQFFGAQSAQATLPAIAQA